ncbi:MAG: DUF1735 domain-containing protein, partial [Bacteroidales bacterium]|nr:DUF1735 domain-containing protein [Bacteroidales bacterium]
EVKLAQLPETVEFSVSATDPVTRVLTFEAVDKISKSVTLNLDINPGVLPAGADILPEAAYEFSAEKVVISPSAGKADVSVTVTRAAELEEGGHYFLPISVSCADEKVKVSNRVIMLVVTVEMPAFQVQASTAKVEDVSAPSFGEAVVRSFDVELVGTELDRDLPVKISVDESAVPEGATLLPAEAYTLPATVTVSSSTKKATVEMTIKPLGSLSIGTNYVLPVKISGGSALVKAVETASCVTAAVSVTRNLAAIPVGGTVTSCKDFFILRDKYLIARNASTGDVLKYEYDAATNSFGEPVTIATGYDATNIRLFGAGPGNSIHYVIGPSNTVLGSGWANVWVMQSTDETVSALKTYDQHDGKISTGCGIFYEEIRGPHSAGLAFVDNATAGIRFYGIKTDGKTLDGTGNGTTGDALFNYGPANYLSRFIYKDDIYAVGAKPGILYRHKYDPATKLFSATRTEVGSNWAQFLNVCQFGDNLLCQKGDASLVMFQFDPDNYTWDANGTATPVAAQ